MKVLDKLEKYVKAPDTQFYGAYFYDGEDILLHDETEEFEYDNKEGIEIRLTIKDYIENGVFHKYKLVEDFKNNAKEETKTEFKVNENDMLIFVMNEGFVRTSNKMITIDEAITRYKVLRSDSENDITRDEEKSIESN